MRRFFHKLDENQMKQTETGFEPRFVYELESNISTTTSNIRSDEAEFEEQEEEEVAEEKAMEKKRKRKRKMFH